MLKQVFGPKNSWSRVLVPQVVGAPSLLLFRVSCSQWTHQAQMCHGWEPELPLALGFSPIAWKLQRDWVGEHGTGSGWGWVCSVSNPFLLFPCHAAIRHDERAVSAAGLCLPRDSFIFIKESNFHRYVFIYKPSIFQGCGKAPSGGGELPQSQRLFS